MRYRYRRRHADDSSARCLCRARASQCEGVLVWERARRNFQPRLPSALFIDERELPVCLWGLCQSNSDGLLLAQVGHRQLRLLPSVMLVSAGRKALIVAVEMVNHYGIFEKDLDLAGTPDKRGHCKPQPYRKPPQT